MFQGYILKRVHKLQQMLMCFIADPCKHIQWHLSQGTLFFILKNKNGEFSAIVWDFNSLLTMVFDRSILIGMVLKPAPWLQSGVRRWREIAVLYGGVEQWTEVGTEEHPLQKKHNKIGQSDLLNILRLEQRRMTFCWRHFKMFFDS